MSTNTKKILIPGNGFNLDLGRETSYKNFYESGCCPKDYPAPIIKHLNEKWVGKSSIGKVILRKYCKNSARELNLSTLISFPMSVAYFRGLPQSYYRSRF